MLRYLGICINQLIEPHLYIRPQSVKHAIIINMSIVIFLGSEVVPAEAA